MDASLDALGLSSICPTHHQRRSVSAKDKRASLHAAAANMQAEFRFRVSVLVQECVRPG